MQYQINAWLDKEHPQLTIINCENRQVVKAFDDEQLNQLFASGDLMPEQLFDANADHVDAMVQDLLETAYSENYPSSQYQKRPASEGLFDLILQASRI